MRRVWHPRSTAAASPEYTTRTLVKLEVVPDRAAVVIRIFEMYEQGQGFRAIAQALTDDGVACPAASDPERSTHRNGLAWASSVVRSILTNPTYTGFIVTIRTTKIEVPRDLTNPSLGHQTKRKINPRDAWVWSPEPMHDAVLPLERWERVQQRIADSSGGRAPRSRRPKSPTRHYALAGLLTCGVCGKSMDGNTSREARYYRCRFHNQYAQTLNHPPTNIRESLVVPGVDHLIASVFDPAHREDTVAELLQASHAEEASAAQDLAAARASIAAADADLQKYHRLADNGADIDTLVGWINEAVAKKKAATARLQDLQRTSSMTTAEDIEDLLSRMQDIPAVIASATPAERKALYRALGISLTYDPVDQVILAQQDLGACWGSESVGGGT